jgi:type IV pilus assembly protein PilC
MPHLFSPLLIPIVEAGEKVGALDVMMERLARYLGAEDRINKKIMSAMAYPAAVTVFFIAAIAGMTLFLIPRFKAMYAGLNATLPQFTLTIFGISDFLIRYIGFIAGGILVLSLYVFNVLLKTPRGKYMVDMAMLKIPLLGNVIKKAALSKFTRTLATLLEQGIAVPESLELVGKTAGNEIISVASLDVSKSILNGEKIPDAFRKAAIFPSLVIQMTSIGAESGNLPALLDKTADFYEEEVDTFLGIMSSLIEPILIVVLGVILGIFIVALYLPVFGMSQAMNQSM